MFRWFKRIFGIGASSENSTGDATTASIYSELEKRAQRVKKGKELNTFSTDWFAIKTGQDVKHRSIRIFQIYHFDKVLSLKQLKDERIKEEARKAEEARRARIKAEAEARRKALALENEVKSQLDSVERFIAQQNHIGAKKALDAVVEKIINVNNSEIRQKYQNLQIGLDNLVAKLEQERLARLAEEKRRREEEEQKRKEAELKARLEKENREREERQRREAEVRRVAEAARKKEQEEQAERRRLLALSDTKKQDSQKYKQLLEDNGIKYLYHFTDKRNIISIKKHGGLLSWHYCKTHNIIIPSPGGNEDSRNLDKRYKLEDYVRLSFCADHPMKYRLEQDGCTMVLLKIKIDVAWFRDTLFSDKNATDSSHKHGGYLDDLRRVNFAATKRTFVQKTDSDFKPHQAEVMVKTFIPKEYIINLDNF